ncbi:PucR family transcriptional regulator [Streptomyces sp. URMC 129]|uniref:PucR family transcriptional regulator n=1 Tax=Streptomyces sp. URMC 129 TaxID=3423407 RepID=UPI003F1DB809
MATAEGAFPHNPWRELPSALAGLLRPRVGDIGSEIIGTVQREVAVYRQPLDSALGRDVVQATRRSLEQFVELTEDPLAPQDRHAEFFQRLGRREYRNGRTTDHLQAAYRAGARVAARWYTSVARAGAFSADVAFTLSDAVLVHISALSNEAVRGYTAALGHNDSDTALARQALAKRLLDPAPASPASVASSASVPETLELLAARARWPWPERVACVVAPAAAQAPTDLEDTTLTLWRGGVLYLVVPEPDSGDRLNRLRRSFAQGTAAIGPAVPPEDCAISLRCARLALRLLPGTPRGGPRGVVDASDHLSALHLLSGASVGNLLAERALAPLRGLTPGKAARLAETLDALLMSWRRTAPEVAEALHIHPQTARYRMRQLEDLFGPRLADPEFRLQALLALRTRALGTPSELPPGRHRG